VAAIRKALYGDANLATATSAKHQGTGLLVRKHRGRSHTQYGEQERTSSPRARFGCVAILPHARSPLNDPRVGGPVRRWRWTLSRKGAKSRPRSQLHLTEAKARVGPIRKTRADLEQQLKHAGGRSPTRVSALRGDEATKLPPLRLAAPHLELAVFSRC